MIKKIFTIMLALLVLAGSYSTAGALTLEEAIATAERENPTVQDMKYAIDQSWNVLRQARAAWWPTLDYQFRISGYLDDDPTRLSATTDDGDFSNTLSLTYSLYDATRGPTISAGQSSLEASKLEYERYLENLRYSVHSAFLMAYLANEALAVQEESRDYYAQLKDEARIRFEEGMIPESDYLTFSNAYDQAQLQAVQYEGDLRSASLALEGLLHMTIDSETQLELPDVQKKEFDVDLEEAVAEALKNRSDVRATEWRLNALRAVFQLTGATKKPSVTLGATYVLAENALSDIDNNDDLMQAYAQMSWRLSDGRKRTFATLEKEAQVFQTEAKLEALKWSVRSEVIDAYIKIDTASRRLAILENTIADAEKNLDILTRRYREGLINDAKITDAELNLSRARLNRISALVNLSVGEQAMKLATGGQK